MALKLLALLALFAACGIVHAQQGGTLCSLYCNGLPVGGSRARSVAQGEKHHSTRSKGHVAPTSRQYPSNIDCAKLCGTSKRSGQTEGGKSSRQGGSGAQFPFNVIPPFGSSASQSSDGTGLPAGIAGIMEYPGQVVNAALGQSGSGSPGGFPFPFPGDSSGGQSSDGTGSPGGIAGMMQYPGQVVSAALGNGQSGESPGFPFNMIPFFGSGGGQSGGTGSSGSGADSSSSGTGSSDSGTGSNGTDVGSSSGGTGSSDSGTGSYGGGTGSSDSGTGSSGGGRGPSGIGGFPGESIIDGFGQGLPFGGTGSGSGQNLASLCEQGCGYIIPNSRMSRPSSSGRKGTPSGHRARHGRQPISTRQAGSVCPSFCHDIQQIIPGYSQGSSGESGSSSTGSGSSSGGSGGSAPEWGESSTDE